MPPNILHYEQWIGPSPYHPYSPQYFGGSSGLNCLFWNMYRDFGVGQMGDMGAHTMDLRLELHRRRRADRHRDRPGGQRQIQSQHLPVKLKVSLRSSRQLLARARSREVWYQGGLKPKPPKGYHRHQENRQRSDLRRHQRHHPGRFHSRLIIPNNDDGDLTYYKRRGEGRLAAADPGHRPRHAGRAPPHRPADPASASPALPPGFTAEPDATPQPGGFPVVQFSPDGSPRRPGLCPTPRSSRFSKPKRTARWPSSAGPTSSNCDWIDACKGRSNNVTHGTSSKTHCDFDYSGSMMEQMLLGLVAHHAGKRLEYDPATGRVTNVAEANDYLKRTYRSGWSLNG